MGEGEREGGEMTDCDREGGEMTDCDREGARKECRKE